jgi:succinate dehydrogenase / fumarate reductase iron-sulfur subunit
MKLKLKIWRQANRKAKGKFETYDLEGLDADMSFLEMLDFLNEKLILEGKSPVVFDHDCREGICGQCGIMIDGIAHGPIKNISTCQLHLRAFEDGQELILEPFRANAFPVKKDLKVDRSSFDRIIEAGGFISVNTGQAPEANSIPITHETAEAAFDAASCIGCGACVATCKNASAALFTSAKISHLSLLPQGKLEREERVLKMVDKMDEEGFGNCSNTLACQVECPQDINVLQIARMNAEFIKASTKF